MLPRKIGNASKTANSNVIFSLLRPFQKSYNLVPTFDENLKEIDIYTKRDITRCYTVTRTF